MYTPPLFAEPDLAAAHALIRAHSFGTLVVTLEGRLEATHLPFALDAERGPKGTLLAHCARANPIWRALDGGEALAIFTGPHAYVSPAWYVDALNVPTWNYVAVHASGRARLLEASATRALLERLVAENEAAKPGPAWSMARLPDAFVDALVGEIVGFELPIEALVAKKKLSQNRAAQDRAGALAGLLARGDPASAAVAELMRAPARS